MATQRGEPHSKELPTIPEYVPGMVRLYGEHTELWYDPKSQEFSVWSGTDWHVWRGSLDQMYAQLQQASKE